MAVWGNFVKTTLTTGISNTDTTLVVAAPTNDWQAPPDPATDATGTLALLTLTDDLTDPTKFEIISYTTRTGTGPYTLTGVTRGVEGTTAQAWSAGNHVFQDLTAGELEYVRSTPMDITVGGATAGSTFDGSLQDALDTILYPYIQPAFTSFALSGYSTLEVGDSIPTGSKTFTFNCSADENVQPNSIDFDNVSDSVNYATGTANDNTETVTFAAPVTRTTVGSKTFRVTGTNTQLNDFTRDYNVNWRFRVFYGESASTSLDEAGIEALRASLLTTTANRTYSMLAGGYKYMAWPTSFSQPTNFKDAATGFAVAMESPVTVNVTNPYGVSQDYYYYRTTNVLTGSIDIQVS